MSVTKLSVVFCALAAGAFTAAVAQAPDCTGVSTVFNANPNLQDELTTVSVAAGLSRPVFVISPPGDTERLFIVEQDGAIKILKNGAVLADPFLDVDSITRSAQECGTNCEQGLLGLAFHPDYASNRYFFILHTNLSGVEVVARYEASAADPDKSLPVTRTEVITLPSPSSNHNGGTIAFSPIDGHLYIGTGDGGSSCNFHNTAQNTSSVLGKMLRLNVDSLPYTTDGNPYDGSAGADEVWALGLRNPYRWSFDRETGAMYIGDVGQFEWEEVDCEIAGKSGTNYGWDFHEGEACPNPSCSGVPPSACNPTDYSDPIVQYSLSGSPCSVIGGYVYRGCRMPDLTGTYFYSDFCSANLETFRTDESCSATTPITRTADLNDNSQFIGNVSSFGEDGRGEIYIVDRGAGATGGELFKILPELDIMEVSGTNAADYLIMSEAEWFWEDLAATSGHVINTYRVFRSNFAPGPFRCKKQTSTSSWPNGDPEDPAPGDVFFYVVSALGDSGQTSIGFTSSGTQRPAAPGICL